MSNLTPYPEEVKNLLLRIQLWFGSYFRGNIDLQKVSQYIEQAAHLDQSLREKHVFAAFTKHMPEPEEGWLPNKHYLFTDPNSVIPLSLDLLSMTNAELISLWRESEYILESGGVSVNDIFRQAEAEHILVNREVSPCEILLPPIPECEGE